MRARGQRAGPSTQELITAAQGHTNPHSIAEQGAFMSPHSSWGPVGTLWLLGEEEPVSFKGTAPPKLPTLRWVSPTPMSM